MRDRAVGERDRIGRIHRIVGDNTRVAGCGEGGVCCVNYPRCKQGIHHLHAGNIGGGGIRQGDCYRGRFSGCNGAGRDRLCDGQRACNVQGTAKTGRVGNVLVILQAVGWDDVRQGLRSKV